MRDDSAYATATGTCLVCVINKQGGDGWFGTVGAAMIGSSTAGGFSVIFADGQFGSLKGNANPIAGLIVTQKLKDTWAAGARVGYLVAPNVLSYVNGGYTGSNWSGATIVSSFTGAPFGAHTNSFSTAGMVRRRRRREQPEHLRHHGAGLVHEDRISRVPITASKNLRLA